MMLTPKKPVKATGNSKDWLICMVASLFPFYAFIQMNFLNTLSSYFIHDRVITTSQLGLLSAGYIYTDALVLLPAGILLDRYATRTLLLWGMGLCTAGGILFASSEQFSLLFLARIISGVGHAFAFLGCFRLASRWFKAQQQGFVIGLIITIALLGGLVAQTPLTLLVKQIGWHKALWLNGIMGLIIMFILWSILPHERIESTYQQTSMLWDNLKVASKKLQNWLCGFYTCLLGLPLMLLGAVWGSTYLVTAKHLTVLEASWITTSIFLGTIIGSPLAGWLSDKLARRKLPMIIGAVTSLLLMLVILYTQNLSTAGYTGLFFLLSLCASTQVLGYPVVAESNPITNSSTAMGFVNVLIMAGIATFQMAFGWIWDNSALQSYAIVLLVFALITSAVSALFIKETLSDTGLY